MHTQQLDIGLLIPESTDCERCLERLESSLLAVRGIVEAKVDRPHSMLSLVIDPDVTGLEAIERGARDVGVELARRFRHETLTLSGLDCMDCASKLERGVGRLDGVVWCSVSFASSQMRVEYEAGRAGYEAIVRRIRELGYDAVADGETVDRIQRSRLAATAASGALLALAALLPVSPRVETALLALSTIAGGGLVMRNGLAALRLRTVDTNLLMGLASVGAALLGHWHEAAMVVFLYGLGNVLEGLALQKNRGALRELVELVPKQAIRIEGGEERSVEVHALAAGDRVRLRPFSRVPVDVRVTHGVSHVDQSSLTGESTPLAKGPGDELLSGTLVGEGLLEGEVLRPHGRDTLSQVLELVRMAQSRKSPSETFSEKFGRIYSPLVLAGAALVAAHGWLATADAGAAWMRALTLLVVACPCALVIATPVAVASALTRAARMGVVVKGGAHLESLASCRAIAFDKTGTLTSGQLEVLELTALGQTAPEELLEVAAIAASGSDHPVARALSRHASAAGIQPPAPEEVRSVPGEGVEARLAGRRLALGRLEFLEGLGYEVQSGAQVLERLRARAAAIAGVGCNGTLLGLVALADRPREPAREAVAGLKELGLDPIVMLTGDAEPVALAVAASVGIDHVRAGLLPAGKTQAVEELARRHGAVAMIGDGVNDAPALAHAAVGLALGAAGNAVAMETADVVFMGTDLRAIPRTFALARKTGRIIRQNMAVSMAAVVAMIGLTLAGSLSLTGAVLAHEGSALIVILNGLRLLLDIETPARAPAGEELVRA
ncbi:MAG: cation-translocating P-type ATPase [Candidatus Wallbacteria bacterium]|nr:cation-translocating P-type ATPase [Candidatus Wallbacteria bacterium]